MNYQELSSLSINELKREPCQCISCPTCRGSGDILVDFHDLEKCPDCYGGVTEVCDRCHLLDELEPIQ